MVLPNFNNSASLFAPPTDLPFRDRDDRVFDLPGWQFVSTATIPVATSAEDNQATLDTSASDSIQVGFFNRNPIFPSAGFNDLVLDAETGYTLSFTAQIFSESGGEGANKNPLVDDDRDRAGFSVIVVGDNPQQALELIFFADGIAALEDGTSQDDPSLEPDDPADPNDLSVLFTHAESADLDTSSSAVEYDLRVLGEQYTLFADGVSVLSGKLRDYTAANVAVLGIDPYEISNFIFFGDDTPSAQASIALAEISLDTTLIAIDLGTFPEHLPQGTSLGTLTFEGFDNADLSFALIDGNVDADGDGEGAFTLNGNTGEITVNDSDELDIETNQHFDLDVKITEGALEDFATVTLALFAPITLPSVSQAEAEPVFEFEISTTPAINTRFDFFVAATGSNPTTPFDFLGGVNPSGVVEIVDGEGTVTVEVVNDNLIEENETFQLLLSRQDSNEVVATATGIIEEDEEADAADSPVFGNLESNPLAIEVNTDNKAPLIFTGAGKDQVSASGRTRLYGGSDNDKLVAITEDRLFGGAGEDTLDASQGSGKNRLYGGAGNDDLFAGSDDRLMGGTGSDRVFALTGGNNLMTGGTGADQFWIVEAAVPDRPNLITDFTSGEDAIAVGFPDLTFADLSLSQDGTSAIIGLNTATPIATLLDFQGNSLTENDFIFAEVPISET